MAKKNFDDFVKAAGRKPKLSPEEVEEMAKKLHQPSVEAPLPAKTPVAAKSPVTKKTILRPAAARAAKRSGRSVEEVEPKEKVRITIDLAKDLYKRMKLTVVERDTEISTYVRMLIEADLSKKKG